MTYLIDTDWLIDVYGGRAAPARTLDELQPQGLAVSIVSYGEMLEGAFGYLDTSARLVDVYRLLSRFETLPLSEPIMEIFGRNRSDMRRAGNHIPDLDLLIGATAVHQDLIVLTRNARACYELRGRFQGADAVESSAVPPFGRIGPSPRDGRWVVCGPAASHGAGIRVERLGSSGGIDQSP